MWRKAWDAAPNDEGTFLNQLQVFEAQAEAQVAAATFSGMSANGRQTSMAPARHGEKTLLETADQWTELIDLFNSLTASQLALIPPGKTDDTTIYNLGFLAPELRGLSGYTTNYMYLSK